MRIILWLLLQRTIFYYVPISRLLYDLCTSVLIFETAFLWNTPGKFSFLQKFSVAGALHKLFIFKYNNFFTVYLVIQIAFTKCPKSPFYIIDSVLLLESVRCEIKERKLYSFTMIFLYLWRTYIFSCKMWVSQNCRSYVYVNFIFARKFKYRYLPLFLKTLKIKMF